jgi:hypothetical protein
MIEQAVDIPKVNMFNFAISDTVLGGGGFQFKKREKKNNVFARLGCLANVRHLLVDKPDAVFQH